MGTLWSKDNSYSAYSMDGYWEKYCKFIERLNMVKIWCHCKK